MGVQYPISVQSGNICRSPDTGIVASDVLVSLSA
jgi:hypothetical protein